MKYDMQSAGSEKSVYGGRPRAEAQVSPPQAGVSLGKQTRIRELMMSGPAHLIFIRPRTAWLDEPRRTARVGAQASLQHRHSM